MVLFTNNSAFQLFDDAICLLHHPIVALNDMASSTVNKAGVLTALFAERSTLLKEVGLLTCIYRPGPWPYGKVQIN